MQDAGTSVCTRSMKDESEMMVQAAQDRLGPTLLQAQGLAGTPPPRRGSGVALVIPTLDPLSSKHPGSGKGTQPQPTPTKCTQS